MRLHGAYLADLQGATAWKPLPGSTTNFSELMVNYNYLDILVTQILLILAKQLPNP